ncbi:hypothetical protein GCM10007108_00220 [Thermogymnomonas acidicola]|uniref:Uncharacterized protein n=1 Tax=Thermogymnomonas acidicola TaxID=399579 RepID=A0AA37BPU3_9ARCH|nr:hypothetical protein [Thermogymnomonas acidicola]GGM65890.1 hypothetical protein GCM10007108_00220 [Thermogymnomonas acidicola]
MRREFEKCFEHLTEDEESAAECIHCLKKHGEQVLYDEKERRLKLAREAYDRRYVNAMKTISEILKVKSRQDYEEIDKKFNLTMY